MADDTTFHVPGSLRITPLKLRIQDETEHYWICWKPDVSRGCTTAKEVLAFASWPASMPTGKALREWLGVTAQAKPEAEPTDNTKMIT